MFGATYRRNALTYAKFSINFEYNVWYSPTYPKIRTLALLVFDPWAIKVGKNLENYTTPFLPENIPSPHHLTLERPEGVVVDPLTL